jgi:bifunctional non-homologous end joining protein LigD
MTAESVDLRFQQGSSDKVYNAELVEDGMGWSVNFAYGRRGSSLTTGSKTKGPVHYGKAKMVYDKLVSSKTAKGYIPVGGAAPINTVVRESTGNIPQLLNEINEKDVESYITDDTYCMQQKHDGRRRMIQKVPGKVIGSNKKGQTVALTPEIEAECMALTVLHTLDGEDMGDHIMIFDDKHVEHLPYTDRYALIKGSLNGSTQLKVTETAWTTEEKRAMYAKLKAQRAEGVVFKDKNATYTEGRPSSGGTQFKCKFYATASCIVSGHHATKSSISLDVYDDNDLIDVGNVTVYPNQTMPDIGDVVEVKYLYFNEGGSLYQPVLIDINGVTTRDDVDGRECVIDKLKLKEDVGN